MTAATPVAAFGLKPVRHLSGGEIRTHQYPISSSYNTAMYNGDLVIFSGGNVQLGNSATSQLLGVFMGCFYTDLGANTGGPRFSNYWPGSSAASSPTDAIAIIADDPNTVFQAYADPGTVVIAQTALGRNITYVAGSGTARTGVSGLSLDSSTASVTTATHPFRVIDRAKLPGNDWSTSGVSINGTSIGLLLEIIFNPTRHVYQQSSGI